MDIFISTFFLGGVIITDKQKEFADIYINSLDCVKSFKSVYKHIKNDNSILKNANKLLNNDDIKEYINIKQSKKRVIADSDEIVEYFTTVMRDESVKSSERLKAAELLAKIYSLFSDKGSEKNECSIIKIIDDIGG